MGGTGIAFGYNLEKWGLSFSHYNLGAGRRQQTTEPSAARRLLSALWVFSRGWFCFYETGYKHRHDFQNSPRYSFGFVF